MDTRRRILQEAIALVSERGVRGVSFRDVARRAGVSHQAPYHYFENHQAILRAIADEGFLELSTAMRRAAEQAQAAPDGDELDALAASGLAYLEFARTRPGHFRAMFQRISSEGADSPSPSSAQLPSQVLAQLTRKARAAGFGRGLSADEVAKLCWSVVHGYAALLVEGIAPLGEQGEEGRAGARLISSLNELLRPGSARARR